MKAQDILDLLPEEKSVITITNADRAADRDPEIRSKLSALGFKFDGGMYGSKNWTYKAKNFDDAKAVAKKLPYGLDYHIGEE